MSKQDKEVSISLSIDLPDDLEPRAEFICNKLITEFYLLVETLRG